MINEALKAFVEKADGDVIRVKVNDRDLSAELAAVGFVGALEEGVFERYVADDVEKAKVFDSLRLLQIAFSGGRDWCPAEVFEYLRDKALLSGDLSGFRGRNRGSIGLSLFDARPVLIASSSDPSIIAGMQLSKWMPTVMLKQFLVVFVVGLPFAVLYSILDIYLPDSWWPAAIVISLMGVARIGLYLYRRSKGIKDTWLDG